MKHPLMNVLITLLLTVIMVSTSSKAMSTESTKELRIATFNVSMEALNYIDRKSNEKVNPNKLTEELRKNSQQIKNIAEIIQRTNPDIILLNEFDRVDNTTDNIHYFINNYLKKSQNNQPAVNFPYLYQGAVNTGVKINEDLNNDNKTNQLPGDAHGFGYFEGHFAMVLLSKYPLDNDNIRTFQHFKWQDMPNALKPINPETNTSWYSDNAWKTLRLSSKSHWDIPVIVEDKIIHVLASHPTPPVFDGPEDRNGKRNHDEIRFWVDYINGDKGNYIYDDSGKKGGLAANKRFVILGDQNASITDGDAVSSDNTHGIYALVHSEKIQDPMPASIGGKSHTPDNSHAKHHTAFWRMRADYVMPSSYGLTLINSGVFWPEKQQESYRLIKDRQASSDHRLVWVDVKLTK
jgi:hypothetical protein